ARETRRRRIPRRARRRSGECRHRGKDEHEEQIDQLPQHSWTPPDEQRVRVGVPVFAFLETQGEQPWALSPDRDSGGGGGIRTHGALARPATFKAAPFDRSGTPPLREHCRSDREESG